MSKKIIWSLVLVIIIVIAFTAMTNVHFGHEKYSGVKMGVIIPMTGDYAAIGEELQRGIELGVDRLNSQGVNITAVYTDDGFDPKNAVSAANKLISVDKADFVVLFSVEEARPVISIFDKAKIPLVVLWDSNSFLESAGPYIYSNGYSTEKSGQKMADFAFNDLKMKKVAVVSHIDAWSDIISRAFIERFEGVGGTIVFNDPEPVGTSDFKAVIAKVKSNNPDGIYAPLIPPDSISFIKQADQYGLKASVMSGDALLQDVIDATGKASDGIYFTNAYVENPELSVFYERSYRKQPAYLVYVAAGYDGILKIGDALKPSEDIKTTLDGLFGDARVADREEKLYQVKSGKAEEVIATSTDMSGL